MQINKQILFLVLGLSLHGAVRGMESDSHEMAKLLQEKLIKQLAASYMFLDFLENSYDAPKLTEQPLTKEEFLVLFNQIKNHNQNPENMTNAATNRLILGFCAHAYSQQNLPKNSTSLIALIIDAIKSNPESTRSIITENKMDFEIPLVVKIPCKDIPNKAYELTITSKLSCNFEEDDSYDNCFSSFLKNLFSTTHNFNV